MRSQILYPWICSSAAISIMNPSDIPNVQSTWFRQLRNAKNKGLNTKLFKSSFQQNKDTLVELNGTGIAMLFSAGTFLYVATVHILPELAAMATTRTVSADGSLVIKEQPGFSKCELLLLIVGALSPLVLSIGHHH